MFELGTRRGTCLAIAITLTSLVAGCTDGVGVTCPTGQIACNGQCTNVLFDPQHCGGCGTVCPGEIVCIAGSCGCPKNQSNCNNICVREDRDPLNCGSCGKACPANQVCGMGQCASSCPSPLATCGQSCIDTQNDPANCGGCGKACSPTQFCSAGVCAGGQCPTGYIRCLPNGGAPSDGGVCVDPLNDPLNCGGCGGADLPTPTPTPSPSPSGTPVPPAPRPPHLCVATPGANTVGVCAQGSCGYVCAPGKLDCEYAPPLSHPFPNPFTRSGAGTPAPLLMSLAPGEEACTDPATDGCNCGACNHPCPGFFSNGFACNQDGNTSACCSSACVSLVSDTSCGTSCGTVAPCASPQPSCCPTSSGNGGACTNTARDVTNCGSCGNNCTFQQLGQALCCNSVAGGPSCVDGSKDINNCGSCGNVCPSPGPSSKPACCPAPSPNPSASPSPSPGPLNSCADLNADTHNCGGCGTDCKTLCGSDGCTNGACRCNG